MNALILLLSARAQDAATGAVPAINAQLYRPPVDGLALLWTDDATRRKDGDVTGRFVFDYANDPLVYTFDNGDTTELVADLAQANLLGGYTLKGVRLGVDVPVLLRTTGDTTAGETGIGDLALDVKGSLLDPADTGFGLALAGRLGFPTSSVEAPLGGDGVGWELSAIFDKRAGENLLLAANVGTRGVPDVSLENVEWKDQFFFRAGAGYAVADDGGLSLDLAGNLTYGEWANTAGRPMEALVGGWGRLGDGPWTMRGGVGTGISQGIGAPKARVVLAFAYEPPVDRDSDLDGLLDSVDACPDQPEDLDGFADTDGCPDPSARVTVKVIDAMGELVPGATAQVSGDGGTGSGGQTFEASLHPGSYAVKASAKDYVDGQASYEVSPDGGELVVVLAHQQGTLALKIVSSENQAPIPGTWSLDSGAYTDAPEGTAQATLDTGEHGLVVRAAGYKTSSLSATVEHDKTTELVVTLDKLVKDKDKDGIVDDEDTCPTVAEDVDGYKDLDGCPDPSLQLTITFTGWDGEPLAVNAFSLSGEGGKTSGEGDKLQTETHPGDYSLTARAAGYRDLHASLSVPEVDKHSATYKLDPKPGQLTIKAFDADDKPIADFFYLIGEEEAVQTQGAVATAELAPGGHRVLVEAPGYALTRVDTTLQPGGTAEVVVKLRPSLIEIVGDRIIVKAKVYFDTSKATIKPESFALLDEISNTLVRRTDIKGVRIEGHTDSQGGDDFNKKLSQDRADSVRVYLEEHEVKAERLTSVGFGEEKPIDTNDTADGRANNRRVEFIITAWDADSSTIMKVKQTGAEVKVLDKEGSAPPDEGASEK